MRLEEYAAHDGLALAELVREGHVTPAELAHLAVRGAERIDPRLGAIAGLYDDAVESAEAAEPGPVPRRPGAAEGSLPRRRRQAH